MFSVGASPFNSRGRQIYGGWAAAARAGMKPEDLQAGYRGDALNFFKDSKWASMAERYSLNPADRELASLIRKASNGVLKAARQQAKNGDMAAVRWLMAYNSAAGKVRNKYRLSSLSPTQRQAIFNRFASIPWNNTDDGQPDSLRMWFAMANRAPFERIPAIPEGIGAVPDTANFVLQNPAYALPAKLSATEKLALARARYGDALALGLPSSEGSGAQAQAYYNQQLRAFLDAGLNAGDAAAAADEETKRMFPNAGN